MLQISKPTPHGVSAELLILVTFLKLSKFQDARIKANAFLLIQYVFNFRYYTINNFFNPYKSKNKSFYIKNKIKIFLLIKNLKRYFFRTGQRQARSAYAFIAVCESARGGKQMMSPTRRRIAVQHLDMNICNFWKNLKSNTMTIICLNGLINNNTAKRGVWRGCHSINRALSHTAINA